MRVLLWHVHGSWLQSFVQGTDEYLLPVDVDRTPDGLGRSRGWPWPANVQEVPVQDLRGTDLDVVVLQRERELWLTERWTGRRPGRDLPAVYVEHNAPRGPAAGTRHPLADRDDLPIVHVTTFNALMWDCGRAPTTVVEHGVVDPGPLYRGRRAHLVAVVNEPVRRWRVAGTDVLVSVAAKVPVEAYGIAMPQLEQHAPHLAHHLHESVRQDRLHRSMADARAYLHPYRWTSLGLSLVEAMTIGMPVLAVAGTAAPEAVPPTAGVVSSDPDVLVRTARRWLRDPDEARAYGAAARAHALDAFSLDRFVAAWHVLLKEVSR